MDTKAAFKIAALLTVTLAVSDLPVRAGVLFDNFPINGQTDAFTVNNGFAVSDSFGPGVSGTATGANVGLWMGSGATLNSLDWAIGTTVLGSDIASGTATPADSLTQTNVVSNAFGYYDVDEVSFDLPSVALDAGTTYYLSLMNVVASDEGGVYWDQNDGAGIAAYQSYQGDTPTFLPTEFAGYSCNGACTFAESFQITGNSTPEPSTWILLASSLAGLVVLRRRRIV